MTKIGYALSSEEHGAAALVGYAKDAEDAGFDFLMISDHFHPWIDRQGNSPFVWGVLGAIAEATERIPIGTGVTCPIIRIHPAIVAQAAATAAQLLPGRFWLGVGTGENLNEHVLGDRWPAGDERVEMLAEAIHVLRELWSGEPTTHRGRYFTVEQARIYSTPDEPPPIYVAAKGERAIDVAAENDGLISTIPDDDVIRRFDKAGGEGKPRIGMFHVCWAEDEATARKTAREWWPNSALPGELSVELPLPRHFEQAAELVTEEDVCKDLTCGPDPAAHLDAIASYRDAGYDHVYVHQIGPDQQGFFAFYEREILPKARG
ncbi:MAG TPA: TIGR03557 family F420-dependent LLM class oxidoreductase [Actinomycetota bacterium]|nr:TIGR03557 family F420-dependent LLM class oxidoreductase [Actinomycetota bacterium]